MISAPFFALSSIVGMFVMMELGRFMGRRQLARDPKRAMVGVGTIDGALFALFGLLIAFTFSGAASRFDSRRQLIAQEANDIGTAYLRLDLLPASAQLELRDLFRNYLDSRLTVYKKLPDLNAAKIELARSEELQHKIWIRAVAATTETGAHIDAAKLLLPALNSMIDITTTRTMAGLIHPPAIIYLLLFALGLGCAMLAGFGMAEERYRNWIHIVAFNVIMGVTLYVILDIEYPRGGYLRIDAYDQVLVELREGMK